MGPNDTVIVSAIWYQNELLPYKELEWPGFQICRLINWPNGLKNGQAS